MVVFVIFIVKVSWVLIPFVLRANQNHSLIIHDKQQNDLVACGVSLEFSFDFCFCFVSIFTFFCSGVCTGPSEKVLRRALLHEKIIEKFS